MSYYIGVDVGSGSVRSALIDDRGHLIAVSTKDIQIWSPKADYYEQSSENIWSCVVHTIKEILSTSGVEKEKIKGIGFDGTCSLVTVGKNGTSLTVSPTGKPECNIIMWMDHRAVEQANRINATQHPVLKFTGGQISVEMEPPKLLWIKENIPETWKKAEHFLELPDFLTWIATGCLTRSLCSLVCKWTYQADDKGNSGWNEEFWEAIGLREFTEEKYKRCGTDVRSPGEVCGQGLTNEVAEQLGLVPNTPVGVSILDAHAGVLGCVGCVADDEHFTMPDLTSRMTMICGTSTCHMIMRSDAILVPGVWGPYYSSILPDMWLTEGGQSAVGKLIDFVVEKHPAFDELNKIASERKVHIHTLLEERLSELQTKNNLSLLAQLTKNFHVWPDFHGNRSPLADTTLSGMISGLTLSCDLDDLAVKYLATIQSLAYGTRHILDVMVKRGHKVELIYMCGGLRKNKLYVKTHVDVTGIPAVLPFEEESVLIGAAMLGASASKNFATLQDAVKEMGGKGKLVTPDDKDYSYHNRKYKVFLKMVDNQREYTAMMKE